MQDDSSLLADQSTQVYTRMSVLLDQDNSKHTHDVQNITIGPLQRLEQAFGNVPPGQASHCLQPPFAGYRRP